ncbi:MAG: hypothetical protein IPP49_15090 [Saprospiraceae bacterium]|nr:hypothetical protein [Saprospiraceae bacterium]
MNRQKNSNLPFITINTEINHPGILCYVGQNSYHSGYLAGRLFSLRLKPGDEIIAFNLGHNLANAQHYSDKVNGLKAYFFRTCMIQNPVFGMNLKNLWMSPKLIEFWHNVQIDHLQNKAIFLPIPGLSG